MEQRDSRYVELYRIMWELYCKWLHSEEGDMQIEEEHCWQYRYSPALGMYKEGDLRLLSCLDDDYADDRVLDVAMLDTERKMQKLLNKATLDTFEKGSIERLQRELLLLKNRKLDCWIDEFFLPMLQSLNVTVDPSHLKGFCFVYHDYADFCVQLTSLFNPDVSNLKQIYTNIYNKKSELHTYRLIEMTNECELFPINPPRFYDSGVDRTIYLPNVPSELIKLFMLLKQKKLYDKLSVRGSNLATQIFTGKHIDKSLEHELETGKLFSIKGIGAIPITKLYSSQYRDCVWIRIDDTNITFEELCEDEQRYEDSIVTQVVHLEYEKAGDTLLINHIDHEFVFYDEKDYYIRINKADIKGEKYPRLKSFKIDNARIPIDLPCERMVTLGRDRDGAEIQKDEVVPFIVLILKSYFKHTELIDEYFEKMNRDENH